MFSQPQQPNQNEPVVFTTQKNFTLQKKRESFHNEIRRQFLQQLFKKKRTEIHNNTNNSDLTQTQQKESKILQNQFSLVDTMLDIKNNLIEFSFKNIRMMNEVEDQPFSALNTSQQQNQAQVPELNQIQNHIKLYSSISNDIYQNPKKYQKMDKKKQEQLIFFWLKYLERNKYKMTAVHKQYHRTIIQFLILFTSLIDSPDLREKILKWVEGTQSLALIFNCISEKFLDCYQFGKIYDIIQKGLSSQNFEVKSQAIDVLLKAIRMSDYDDISLLLQQRSQLFTSLLIFFQNQQLKDKVYHGDQETMHCVIKAAYCVNLFLTTYDEYVLNCLKQGAGYVGAWLICQNNKMMIRQGLQILSIIAGIQDHQYKVQAQIFLLSNSSIDDTGVWYRLGRTYEIVGHQDPQVKNYFLSFISTFFANSNLSYIIQLNEKFEFPNKQSLVYVLILMFKHNDCPNILLNILKAFQSIFYYDHWSKNYDYDEDLSLLSEEDENSHQPEFPDDFKKQKIIIQMKNQNLINKMQDLYNRQNVDQSLREQIKRIFQMLEQN